MKSDAMHRWATLGANLGVLLGLFFLVAELNQNADMMRAQTRNELSTSIVDLFARVSENGDLASLRRRADAGEALTEDESYRYTIITRAFFRYWENVHYQFRQGLYDNAEFSKQREAWATYAASSEAVVSFWCGHRREFSAEFASEFDMLIPGNSCPPEG